jgi:hypothetical protein
MEYNKSVIQTHGEGRAQPEPKNGDEFFRTSTSSVESEPSAKGGMAAVVIVVRG